MTAAELLQALVAIPSVSGDEGRIADTVSGWAEGWGARVQRQGHNVWFSVGSGPRRLLVNSHLDTVKPCAGWTYEPHAPVWREDRLYGLGSNDAKGCVTGMLLAARTLLAEGAPTGAEVVFAFTAEEETGGQGLGTLLPNLGPLDAAIVGEPTSLKPCTAQRGMLLLRCTAHGKSAHVAHAHATEAVNAIHLAATDIAVLAELRFPPHPLLGEARAQVTQVSGGLARNQVPDRCEFFVDLRTTPGMEHAMVARQVAGALKSEVKVHSERYLPKATSAEQPIVRAAVAASGAQPVGSSTASDWAFLGDIPAVKVGPGDTLRSHLADEFITRAELEAGAAFYTQLVRGYFEEVARG
ncbi:MULTISPECIES: M20/M25/M40 family metallo-hydrolase [Myxococcus]|uniref:Peptidase M20 n=1 Tax=Myxococcus xanthus TaxID=34 RepID=A0AAE6G3A4_MYXXA|nr:MULTISPECIES: M20/M25/M40 family metallo-hydrolase [Myxococcus]QDE70082.1 peptidase M20 [Myxococcus xanthus]QDE77361.1 peptidase M20 [Myxococcus xanthus]QDE98911.1 peptidase M20 [Myxococcus xanthus]QDF06576.1 peptidase M20 [Myxococcus xanthus]WAM24170.1 M20/M25/M40 family metallo-hydrolase [Myxococcus sp. NMCA1]